MDKKVLKISVSDWLRIGRELNQNDPKFTKKAEAAGLTKEAGLGDLLMGRGWNPNKVDYDKSFALKNQNAFENQEALKKLHTWLQENPNIIQLVPRLKQVQSDIQSAHTQVVNQQRNIKRIWDANKAQTAAAAGQPATQTQTAVSGVTGHQPAGQIPQNMTGGVGNAVQTGAQTRAAVGGQAQSAAAIPRSPMRP